MSLNARRGLALLSGLLLWLSFPNVFALEFQTWPGWIAWVALVPLCWALWLQPAGCAFRLAWLSGTVFFILSFSWLTNVRPMGPAAYPAWFALALWCGVFVAFWGWLVSWVSRRNAPQPSIVLAAAWALLELLRERALTGFPWVNLGSSQAFNPAVLPLAAITGQVGLHFAVALANLFFFAILVEQKILLGFARSSMALLCMGLLAWGVQVGRQSLIPNTAGPRVKVAIIQGGIDQDQAWTPDYRALTMRTYLGLSESAVKDGAQALLWPESAYPGFFNEDAVEAKQLKAFARAHKVQLMIGSTFSEDRGYRNSALWIGPEGNTLAQAKRHLVPFGEYVPFMGLLPILDGAMARLGVSGFLPGTSGPLFNLGGLQTQPLICYESIFPAIAREGGHIDLLGVITEDTWYGHSAAPVYHASQCVLRAVENGCWVGRSAATGISLFVDPQGRLLQPIALDQAGYRVADISQGRSTFYREHGEWLAGLFLLLLAGLLGPLALKKS